MAVSAGRKILPAVLGGPALARCRAKSEMQLSWTISSGEIPSWLEVWPQETGKAFLNQALKEEIESKDRNKL